MQNFPYVELKYTEGLAKVYKAIDDLKNRFKSFYLFFLIGWLREVTRCLRVRS